MVVISLAKQKKSTNIVIKMEINKIQLKSRMKLITTNNTINTKKFNN